MSSLVIHAHPVPDSFSAALFTATIEGLTAADGVAPAAASLCRGDDPDSDDLGGITTLAFVYPTWWGGQPAVLLDWIQRRLGPWIDGERADSSPVASLTTLAAITTHGSPRWVNAVTGEPGRRLLGRSVRALAAPTCSWHWLAYYGMDANDAATRTAFLTELPSQIRRLRTT